MTTQTRCIGYLTNLYPAVSHSFIRREILALEKLGLTVVRWSVRPSKGDLPDLADQNELEKTHVLLGNPFNLILPTVIAFFSNPMRFLRALRVSLDGRPAGVTSFIVRFAHLAEAGLLLQLARETRVSHIHAHFGTNPASVARLCKILGGPTFSFTVHGPDEFDQPQAICLGGKVADASFAVAISNFGRSQIMRWSAPENWSDIHVVRCGLDDAFLEVPSHDPTRDTLPVFSCVARLAPQKGLPVLIDAAALLHSAGHVFRFRIVGDGPLKADLIAAAKHAGVEQCFEFMGWQSAQIVKDVVASSRAFVLPSFGEGLPVAIMEALALAIPVITTRIAGIPELVDQECGWLVDAGDTQSLADAILEAIECSPAELLALGRAGRARVQAAHNATRNAKQLLAYFEDPAK